MPLPSTDHVPDRAFETLPPGKYLAMIVASEWRDTKAGDGQYLQLTWEVIEGQGKGRKLWQRLNLSHPKQETVDIALQELKRVKAALGKPNATDEADLHGTPALVKIINREYNGSIYEDVKDVEPRSTAAAPSAAARPQGW